MGSEKFNPVVVVGNFVVKKSGILDFDKLFKAIPKWMKDYNYDPMEKSHSEKKTPTGIYIESSWKGSRKVTEYVKFIITVDVLLRDLTDVAVQDDKGKQVKRQKGRVELVFNAKMEKNYKKNINEDKGSLGNFFKMIYEKYVAKSELEKYEDKLYDETTDFIETLKGYFY
ncbi:MAG: hypothetical protein KKA65_03115 [Nanoarchaeota archaeon]|nr:hypothetical protein [Nanoarchaeota archaeon]MBU4242072.1 hypothetical protein [Nanoarchaeota archaeon]MBU4352592.1 hypothetical protein [Nanoarchaeota archaeon]MBU4456468.1 hypothetical protein [Nanoarchaeota archaeon]MCG2720332.1 hypothetical protein [Nanoarchaeota archaeon]